MAIRLYYEKKESLVGKTVHFAPAKCSSKDREILRREYSSVDDTVKGERLLAGTPCVVTRQTLHAPYVYVIWENNSGTPFKTRLPLRFFEDEPGGDPKREQVVNSAPASAPPVITVAFNNKKYEKAGGYTCDVCDYWTPHRSNFSTHKNTIKHKLKLQEKKDDDMKLHAAALVIAWQNNGFCPRTDTAAHSMASRLR